MKEISMRIPDGTRKVTVEIGDDGKAAIRYEKPEVKVEENQLLFDALAKEGKRWNADKKCIEDLPRWRAKKNETYYFIGIDVEVMDNIEYGYSVDDACYSAGNYFKTREAAEHVVRQIREIFKNSKAE